MHDGTLWAAWYLMLLAIPFFIIGSLIREKLADRRAVRLLKTLPQASVVRK